MKRRYVWLLICGALLLAGGCSKKQSPQVKRQPVAEQPQEEEQEEPIQAATPEDPGPVATVVGPMTVWTRKAQSRPSQPADAALAADAARPEAHPNDHVALDGPAKPKNFLHAVFPVANYSQFVFVVPPHQTNPKLHGNFRSFTNPGDPDSSSNNAANVDLMLLNEQEFDDFVHGRPGNATYELDSSHSQMVEYVVPSTRDQAREYHLVFQTSSGGTKIFVKANFTVSFE